MPTNAVVDRRVAIVTGGGKEGNPGAWCYAAAKAGVIAKMPMGRLGRPEKVAHLVNWPASDGCTISTGAAFDISGGRATY